MRRIDKLIPGIFIFGSVVTYIIGKIINPSDTLFGGGLVGLAFLLFGFGIFILVVSTFADIQG